MQRFKNNTSKSKAARPSVDSQGYQVKNMVNPDIREAQKRLEQRKEKQRASVLGASLNKKSEKDFNIHNKSISRINSKFKRIFIICLIAILVVFIGILVAATVFFASSSSKLSIGASAESKLVHAANNQPFYTLFAVNTDNNPNNKPGLLTLCRFDPSNRSLILIDIPMQTYVVSNNGGASSIDKIYDEQGDEGLIEVVSSLSETGIAYFYKLNNESLYKLIDSLDGIEVDLKEYVDDAEIGDVYIPKGVSKIGGIEAKALLLSKNFKGGATTINYNKRQVCLGLFKSAILKDRSKIAVLIDEFAGDIKCNMNVSDIISLIKSCSNIDNDKILTADIPGYKTVRNNNMVFMVDAAEWKKMRSLMSYGSLPSTDDDITISDVNPGSFTISVQNGSGVDGAGAMLSDKLNQLGFSVAGVQNADSSAYEETLIIYNGDNNKNNAYAIKNSIDNGRVIKGDGLYNMNTDILLIIGLDYKI